MSHSPDHSPLTGDGFSVIQWSRRFVSYVAAKSTAAIGYWSNIVYQPIDFSQVSQGSDHICLDRKSRNCIGTLKLKPLFQCESKSIRLPSAWRTRWQTLSLTNYIIIAKMAEGCRRWTHQVPYCHRMGRAIRDDNQYQAAAEYVLFY